MEVSEYLKIKKEVIRAGFDFEIEWARNIKPCKRSMDFFMEYSWVVISSGMKNQVARKIWERVQTALLEDQPVLRVYRNKGKASAIESMWKAHEKAFQVYRHAHDKLAFLKGLPQIGEITKFHLAKNLGLDVCKPDRHLVRIASRNGLTPEQMCRKLSRLTGDRIATVDTVIWRAANLGIIK